MGRIQLAALLQWQYQTRRGWGLVAQLVTPVLLVLILVAAYRLSDVEPHPAATHADWSLQLPWTDDANNNIIWDVNETLWSQLLLTPQQRRD